MSEMDTRGEPATADETAQDIPVEAPEADLAEQRRPVREDDDAPSDPGQERLEADPADTADQRRTVALDEDDYR